MKHASLFTGIGGFDLAAQWMGWENVFQVEIDKFCQKVLEKNFPNVKRYGDIKQFNGTEWAGKIDVLSGGFPCQPFSVAGPRQGIDDDRYLWPELIKTIRAIKPPFVVCENVPGILGLAFKEVCTDLESSGYQVETFIIPACGVGAIHKRSRVWIIAYANQRGGPEYQLQTGWDLLENGNAETNANANSQRLSERQGKRGMGPGPAIGYQGEIITLCDAWPTEPGICRADDGIPNRVDRIKSLGNAIVPQVAFEIFKAISSTMK